MAKCINVQNLTAVRIGIQAHICPNPKLVLFYHGVLSKEESLCHDILGLVTHWCNRLAVVTHLII